MNKIKEVFENKILIIISGILLIPSIVDLIHPYGLKWYFNPAILTVVFCGLPIFYEAIYKLFFKFKITSSLLITIASVACLISNELFAAGEILFLMALGELLEDLTVSRAHKGLDELIALVPNSAKKLVNGIVVDTAVEDVKIGDIIRVLPGDKIPLDGTVIKGLSDVNESLLTGESLEKTKTIGDDVYAGTISSNGSLDIKVSTLSNETTLSKIINLSLDVTNKKAPAERIADKLSTILVPLSLLTAVIVYLIFKDVNQAITILVVFCPCALVLSTPTAISAAIGQATKHGVIIKSGRALETLGSIKTIAFDKTGTLTNGEISLEKIEYEEENHEFVNSIAYSIESLSTHPLARGITQYLESTNTKKYDVTDYSVLPGLGLEGSISGVKYYIGNKKSLANFNIKHKPEKNTSKYIYLHTNKKVLATFVVCDTIRMESKKVICDLHENNINCVMLTGDNTSIAKNVSESLGIDKTYSELLPKDKLQHILELQKEEKIAMVGDGINDAPAMSAADVSISLLKNGSDVAIESSDIVLMNNSLEKLPYLNKLSKVTKRTIIFNMSMALIINLIAIILSILKILDPVTGALVHNVGSVAVIFNATLLYDKKIIKKKE